MQTARKTLTAFRIESCILERIKARAKNLNVSVNKYVTDIIIKDLNNNSLLPKASLSAKSLATAKKYSGILHTPSINELQNDERLKAIWER